jgi:hypothetical protein
MTKHIADHLAIFTRFWVEFEINYSTAPMVVLLIPRLMGGYLFILIDTSLRGENTEYTITIATELIMKYKHTYLSPYVLYVAKFIENAKKHAHGESAFVDTPSECCDFLLVSNLCVISTCFEGKAPSKEVVMK